ncbi:MAG: asparagine synthase (glutamine-hydrolyzing) [Desulfatiglandaceae bacterium]
MCGICGIHLQDALVDRNHVLEAAQKLQHRGPDRTGSFFDGPVGLAHTRLSIIDLSGGDQPLFAQNRELVLIANGEIYNYVELRRELEKKGRQFETHSDSEVILHAYMEYGSGFLEHLNGMFAFALYDKTRKELLLARDRLGIKPLFIGHLPRGVAFASELKALFFLNAGDPQIDPVGLAGYFQNQFATETTTVVKDVERVLPGEAVILRQGRIAERWRYWSPLKVRPAPMDFAEAQERFDAIMTDVMVEHMRSDVPFGLFLSGGVDSSILLALLNHHANKPLRTFSVGFSGTRIRDELPVAERLAKRFATRHTAISPTPADIFSSLPLTVWAADELMRDYANLPTVLLAKAAGSELKVVFSGEGGDEVFAGYGRYRSSVVERWFKGMMAPGSGGFRTRGTLRGSWPRRLFKKNLLEAAESARGPFVRAWKNTPQGWSDLQRMQYVDLTTALPDNLLVKLDRMLMAWSLEGRVPFLDHRVVEFGLSLPDHLKVMEKQGKFFLKKWAARFLPEDHLFTPKQGFHVPVGEWLKGDLLDRLQDVLPRHPAIRQWFRVPGVKELIGRCRTSGPTSRTVWALFQFALWHQIFVVEKGRRPAERMDPVEMISR